MYCRILKVSLLLSTVSFSFRTINKHLPAYVVLCLSGCNSYACIIFTVRFFNYKFKYSCSCLKTYSCSLSPLRQPFLSLPTVMQDRILVLSFHLQHSEILNKDPGTYSVYTLDHNSSLMQLSRVRVTLCCLFPQSLESSKY